MKKLVLASLHQRFYEDRVRVTLGGSSYAVHVGKACELQTQHTNACGHGDLGIQCISVVDLARVWDKVIKARNVAEVKIAWREVAKRFVGLKLTVPRQAPMITPEKLKAMVLVAWQLPILP